MTIEPFLKEDIAAFLDLAISEGWVAERWEFDFLLSAFPEGCLCVRDDSGAGIGFVTSLRHERSGWIGNLIVNACHRGQGIGEMLFLQALQVIREAGADTCWLTASKQGQPLYEKLGFTTIDTVIRWVGTGRQRPATNAPPAGSDCVEKSAVNIDSRAWGDRRDALLAATVGRGTLLLRESGFLVVQPCGNAMQFGPFSAQDSNTAEHLLDTALRTVTNGTKVYMDAPASNRSALRMLNRRRMRIAGTTELMYAGKKPEYRPEYLFGLATMGSSG